MGFHKIMHLSHLIHFLNLNYSKIYVHAFFFLSHRLFCNEKKYHQSFMSLYIILLAEYWARSGLQIFKVSVMSNRDINPDTHPPTFKHTVCLGISAGQLELQE